jgi:hypothetical protein
LRQILIRGTQRHRLNSMHGIVKILNQFMRPKV